MVWWWVCGGVGLVCGEPGDEGFQSIEDLLVCVCPCVVVVMFSFRGACGPLLVFCGECLAVLLCFY